MKKIYICNKINSKSERITSKQPENGEITLIMADKGTCCLAQLSEYEDKHYKTEDIRKY